MKIQPFRLVSSHRLLTGLAPLLASLVTLLPATAHAQGAIEAWVQRYNGPANGGEPSVAMAVEASGNVVVTVPSYGGDPLYGDDWATIKYSSTGVPLWTNCFNGLGNAADWPYALAVDTSGNCFVTGFSYDGSDESRTIKYSSAGVPLWTNVESAWVNGYEKASAADADGNVVVTGSSYNGANTDFVTIKYSSAGVALWTKRYNGAGNGNDDPVALAVDANRNVYVTGRARSPTGSDYTTIKYSSAGVPLWTNLYRGSFFLALALDRSGDVLVTGCSQVDTNTWNDYATIKYSSAGVPLWTNRYDGPANGTDEAYAVAVDANGNVVVTGTSEGSGPIMDYATIKYSSAGVPLWTNRYNGPGNGWDRALAVAVDARGNVYVTGNSDGSGTGRDYATVAYSSAGVPLWTNRYNGPENGSDIARAVAVDAGGGVYVAGYSKDSDGDFDLALVKYIVPPIIAMHPLSRTNAVGTTASFTVEAVGGVPLNYQWRRQETNLVDVPNLSGVTTTNLLVANVQAADAAGYTVVVTNAYGSATSSVAQLTLYVPPNPGRFTRLAYSPETGFSFIFRDATVGQPYRIQRSPSMAEGSWTNWQSFTYNGPIGFIDVGAAETTNKFYRAVSP